MAGGLDNLSAEGFSQLSKTINEAKELIKQQEALLQRTLAMEQQIINRRVAGLREYNDEYSRLLNRIASDQDSLRADMLKITEAGKKAAANAEKAAKNAKQAQAASGDKSAKGNRAANQTLNDAKRSGMGDVDSAEWENFADRYKARKDAIFSEDQLKAAMAKREEERIASRRKKEKAAHDATIRLIMAREQAQTHSTEAIRDAELSRITSISNAELKAQELRDEITAELSSSSSASEDRVRLSRAIEEEKALRAYKLEIDQERQKMERQARKAGGGSISALEQSKIDAALESMFKGEEKLQKFKDNAAKKRDREQEKSENARAAKTDKKIANAVSFNNFSREDNWLSRMKSLYEMQQDAGGDAKATAAVIIKALGSLAQQLEKKVDEIAAYKGKIDTRLYGTSQETLETWAGSYWDQIVHDMTSVGAITPYFKQEDFAKNIEKLVDKGIAFDLEQRAFLMTIKDKIATTFDATDGTLLRLVRIQQQDSTAGRLGMEAALNAFLNEMYATTEYLSDVASSVRASLQEMEALMEGAAATEVEYQVQKWLGSLYSVGMSQNAINSISTALGQVGSGQIEGLTGGGAGNLLIMAAARTPDLSIADILTNGIDADKTNDLMQAAVNYLAELAESSKDNQVVQQQLATVFGVRASDLRAATNLATKGSISAIADNSQSYDEMLGRLADMTNSMFMRTSLGEMMTNVWDNLQYSLAGGMASNPISYLLYKTATLLENTTGGIGLPFVSAAGFGVDLNTTVSDLMRVGALSTGVLGSFGPLIQGLNNSFIGSNMLSELGIESSSGLKATPRGDGSKFGSNGGASTSSSGMLTYAGNASGSDIQSATMQEANDTKTQLMVEAQENAEATQIDTINSTVLKIYELLDDVAHGNSYLRVKVEGYGLTRAGSTSNAIGGVSALGNLSDTNSIVGPSTGLSSSSVSSGSFSNNLEFSGWTTTL